MSKDDMMADRGEISVASQGPGGHIGSGGRGKLVFNVDVGEKDVKVGAATGIRVHHLW